MANHKWQDNKCMHCGIMREIKEKKTIVAIYTKLSRSGVWYDANKYRFDIRFFYKKENTDIPGSFIMIGWERPDCLRQNIAV